MAWTEITRREYRRDRMRYAISQTNGCIRIFYSVTLPSEPVLSVAKYTRHPEKLPVVLSTDEAARLVARGPNFNFKVLLAFCYSGGWRVSELKSLKVGDIAELLRDQHPHQSSAPTPDRRHDARQCLDQD